MKGDFEYPLIKMPPLETTNLVLADFISFASPCKGKAQSFRRSSSPNGTRFAGLPLGPHCGSLPPLSLRDIIPPPIDLRPFPPAGGNRPPDRGSRPPIGCTPGEGSDLEAYAVKQNRPARAEG